MHVMAAQKSNSGSLRRAELAWGQWERVLRGLHIDMPRLPKHKFCHICGGWWALHKQLHQPEEPTTAAAWMMRPMSPAIHHSCQLPITASEDGACCCWYALTASLNMEAGIRVSNDAEPRRFVDHTGPDILETASAVSMHAAAHKGLHAVRLQHQLKSKNSRCMRHAPRSGRM